MTLLDSIDTRMRPASKAGTAFKSLLNARGGIFGHGAVRQRELMRMAAVICRSDRVERYGM